MKRHKRGERGRHRQTDRQTDRQIDRVGYIPSLSFAPFYLLIPLCLRSLWWILWLEMSTNLKTRSLETVALVNLLSLESEDQRKGIQASTLSWMRGKECDFFFRTKGELYVFLQETWFLSISRLCEISHKVYLSATGQSEHCLPFSAHERKVWRLRRVEIMWFLQIEDVWQSWIKMFVDSIFQTAFSYFVSLCPILRLIPESLEREHWLQDPGLPEN